MHLKDNNVGKGTERAGSWDEKTRQTINVKNKKKLNSNFYPVVKGSMKLKSPKLPLSLQYY